MTSVLPSRPNLEYLKKQAKDILAAHHAHLATCCPVLRHLHRFKASTDQEIFAATVQLADVQFALAMDYGFTTWEGLVGHLQNRGSGLSEDSARALARLRKGGVLAKLIGGEPKSISGGDGGAFAILEIEGPDGRFVIHEAQVAEEVDRLNRQKRVGEFLNALGVHAVRLTILDADGRAFGAYRKLEGRPLGSDKLSSDELKSVASQVGSLLVRLHEVPLAHACRVLGLPDLEATAAAQRYRLGHDWFNADAFERGLATELAEDRELNAIWEETRQGMAAYASYPRDLVFGHGDLLLDRVLLAKTPEGYRVTGVNGLWNAGLVNLYDEFLRIALHDNEEGEEEEWAILQAYNLLRRGQPWTVQMGPLKHAVRAFWFYLAHEQAGEDRKKRLASAKYKQRGW
ncbi:MAG: phosphotransferase [Planctomycetota bacterium]